MSANADFHEQFQMTLERWRRHLPSQTTTHLSSQSTPQTLVTLADCRDFGSFCERNSSRILHAVKDDLHLLAFVATILDPWMAQPDLFDIALLRFGEDGYTELMKWALHPPGEDAVGLAVQCGLLGYLELPLPEKPARIATQFRTIFGNYPDMVMDFETFALIFEAKTGTEEHDTVISRTGAAELFAPQTKAYPGQVRESLEHLRLRQAPVHIAFISPDGRVAANENAFQMTYLEFAMVIARALSRIELEEPTKWAYKFVISHFARCGISESAFSFLCSATIETAGVDALEPISELLQRITRQPNGDN